MGSPRTILALSALVYVLGFNIWTTNAFPHFDMENEKPGEVEVKINDAGTRQRRSANEFPDELNVDLSTDEMQKSFHNVRRNSHISTNVPLSLMREGRVKKYRFDSKKKVAYYLNEKTGAAFMAWKRIGRNGTTVEIDVYGTFIADNVEYLVQPPQGNEGTYTVSKITEKKPYVSDYVSISEADVQSIQENADARRQMNLADNRVKRQTATNYEIEIYFVLDHAMYERWYNTTEGETNRTASTFEYMTQFTGFLLNAIDLRYQTFTNYGYTVSCVFAGLYIADTEDAAPFYDESSLFSFGFIASPVLTAFKDWAEEALVNESYDHAMMFSGYEMGSADDGQFNSAIAGLAYLPSYNANGEIVLKAVCGGHRYSINEGGDFSSTMATIAAHELGHNLGSYHDNSTNNCGGDGFVMEASFGVSQTADDNLNLWVFSSCSQFFMNAYIDDLDEIANNGGQANCLTSRDAVNADDLDPYVNDTAGQVYDPDVQCEWMQEAGSFMHRGYFDGNYSTFCVAMPCSTTDNSGTFYFHIPWEGTTCGNGTICQSGSCVESVSAPYVNDETCPFGDVPGNVLGQSSGCQDFVGNDANSYRCYNDGYRSSCCATCEEIKQNNTGYTDCEYGDQASNCGTATDTNLYSCTDDSFRADCCKSCVDKALDIPDCMYGDRYSNCEPTEAFCTAYPVDCCQTCAPSTTTTTPTSTTTTPTTTITTHTTTTATTPTTTTTTPTTTTTTTTPTTTTTTPTATITTTTTLTPRTTITSTTPTTTTTTTLTTTITTTPTTITTTTRTATHTTTTITNSTTSTTSISSATTAITPTTMTTTPATTTTSPATITTIFPTTKTTTTTTSATTAAYPTTPTTTPTITTTTPTITTTTPTTTTTTPTTETSTTDSSKSSTTTTPTTVLYMLYSLYILLCV